MLFRSGVEVVDAEGFALPARENETFMVMCKETVVVDAFGELWPVASFTLGQGAYTTPPTNT